MINYNARILIACEESQTVLKEFLKLGFKNVWSCDIMDTSGDYPERHLKRDVRELLKEKWDLIIGFPPCTHLAVSGARHFEKKREDGRQEEGIRLFMDILNANCDKIVVENPVNIISGKYIEKHYGALCKELSLPIKPTQRIQPYQFGDNAQKLTCLWIKGLEPLKPTNIVDKGEMVEFDSGKRMPKWYSDAFKLSKEERSKVRSKTFKGIAKAIAEQFGKQLIK